jgi:hypothetical protein
MLHTARAVCAALRILLPFSGVRVVAQQPGVASLRGRVVVLEGRADGWGWFGVLRAVWSVGQRRGGQRRSGRMLLSQMPPSRQRTPRCDHRSRFL